MLATATVPIPDTKSNQSTLTIEHYQTFFANIIAASWDQQNGNHSLLKGLRENLIQFLRKFLQDQNSTWSIAKKNILIGKLKQYLKLFPTLNPELEKLHAEIIHDIENDVAILRQQLAEEDSYASEQFMEFINNQNWEAQTGQPTLIVQMDLQTQRKLAEEHNKNSKLLKDTNLTAAIKYAENAVSIGSNITRYSKSNEQDQLNLNTYKNTLATSYFLYALQLQHENRFYEAAEYFNHALTIFNEIKSTFAHQQFIDFANRNLAKIYDSFAKDSVAHNDIQQAIKYRKKAIEMIDQITLRTSEDNLYLIDILKTCSSDYLLLGQYIEAGQIAEKVIELCNQLISDNPNFLENCKSRILIAKINCAIALTKLADRCFEGQDYNQTSKNLLKVIRICITDLLPDEHCKIKPAIVNVLYHATTQLMQCALINASQNCYLQGISLSTIAIKSLKAIPPELNERANLFLIPTFQISLFIIQTHCAFYWSEGNNPDECFKQLKLALKMYDDLPFHLFPKEPNHSINDALLTLARMLNSYVQHKINNANDANVYYKKIIEVFNRVPGELLDREDRQIYREIFCGLYGQVNSPSRLFIHNSNGEVSKNVEVKKSERLVQLQSESGCCGKRKCNIS